MDVNDEMENEKKCLTLFFFSFKYVKMFFFINPKI